MMIQLLPFLISCPAPMDDFVVICITLPPIAIHETTQEQVVPHLPGFRVRDKALQLASSTRTSYLRLVLRGAQNLFTMPSVIVRTMVACGVEQNDILEPRKNLA